MTFPVALDVRDRLCLVVGSSPQARERVERLCAEGALVRWVTSPPAPDSPGPRVEMIVGAFSEQHLDGVWLAVLADATHPADPMYQGCTARRLFFCATDQPAYSSFHHMALVESPPLKIAISTQGLAPALARRLREELDKLFDSTALQAYTRWLVELRARTPPHDRTSVLSHALEGFAIDGRLVIPPVPDDPTADPHSNSGSPESGSGAG